MNELNANENENQKIINFMEISKINDRELAKKYFTFYQTKLKNFPNSISI